MWPLLQKKQLKVYLFFPQLILLSLLLHLLIIFIMFLSKQQVISLHMKVNKDQFYSKNIIVLPFEKTIPGALEKLGQRGSERSKGINGSKLVVKKSITKSRSPKIFVDNKKIIKNKKSLEIEKLAQQKESQKMELAEEPVLVETEILPEKVVLEKNINVNEDTSDNVLYIGRQDLQIIELYQDVQQEILLHWFPPSGLSKDLKCVASFKVDLSGNISDIKIDQSSKALAYDLSVRNSISKIKLPKQVWGKRVSLEFIQG